MIETGKRSRRDNDNDDKYQKRRVNTSSRRENDNDDRYEKKRVNTNNRRDNDNDDKYEKKRVNTIGRRDYDNDDKYEKRRVNTSSRRDDDIDDRFQRKRVNTSRSGNNDDRDNSDDGELVVYRILCPGGHIGSVIGKSGKVINSLRQETHSKIKVVDPFPGTDERVILIFCYVKYKDDKEVDEDDTRPLCSAQDALLKVHTTISNTVYYDEDEKKRKEEARLLVPGSQVANIIGKSGSTIKNLRAKTKTNIKITPKDPNDPTHSCAMSFDNFVQITGDTGAVKKALFAISAIMFKFSPKEEISLDTTVPDLPRSIIIPTDAPNYSTSSFYPGVDAIAPPSRSVPPVIPTSHVPELHEYTESGVAWPVYSSSLPIESGYDSSSQSEELKLRVLCPSDRIGLVIGKGGSSIKNVRQESGAHVDVEKLKDGCDECVITVTSKESTGDMKSAAVEAVLLLQERINDNDYDDTAHIRILVPSRNIGCIIGKSGSIIKDMCKRTKAEVRISRIEKPKCAEEEDELVEVTGEVRSVRDALVQIVLRLRDAALKVKEGGRNAPNSEPPQPSLYSAGPSVPSSVLPSFSPLTTIQKRSAPSLSPPRYDQRVETGSGLGMLSSSSLYGYGSLQAGENGYGSIHSYLSKPYGGLPSTLEIVIPASALGKVMGKGGSNLENIRKISGAIVEVIESKSSRPDYIAQISGTPEQKRAAENLIQAFILAT